MFFGSFQCAWGEWTSVFYVPYCRPHHIPDLKKIVAICVSCKKLTNSDSINGRHFATRSTVFAWSHYHSGLRHRACPHRNRTARIFTCLWHPAPWHKPGRSTFPCTYLHIFLYDLNWGYKTFICLYFDIWKIRVLILLPVCPYHVMPVPLASYFISCNVYWSTII